MTDFEENSSTGLRVEQALEWSRLQVAQGGAGLQACIDYFKKKEPLASEGPHHV
jgi:hypothetical protein